MSVSASATRSNYISIVSLVITLMAMILAGCLEEKKGLEIVNVEASYGSSELHGGPFCEVNVTVRNGAGTLGEYVLLIQADLVQDGKKVGSSSYENLEKVPQGTHTFRLYIESIPDLSPRTVVVKVYLNSDLQDKRSILVSL